MDFPPQMQVMVDGCILRVRYPAEHAEMKLNVFHEEATVRHAALYMQVAGRLCHIRLKRDTNTLCDFVQSAAAQLDTQMADYLRQADVLREAESQQIITDNTALVKCLQARAPVILVT